MLKVGQKVRVVRNKYPYFVSFNKEIGKEGVVVEKGSDHVYKVKLDYNSAIRPFEEEELEPIEKEVTMKDAKFGLKYERDEDPTEYFKTEKELNERVEELLDDDFVDKKKKIYKFDISNVQELVRPVNFDWVSINGRGCPKK